MYFKLNQWFSKVNCHTYRVYKFQKECLMHSALVFKVEYSPSCNLPKSISTSSHSSLAHQSTLHSPTLLPKKRTRPTSIIQHPLHCGYLGQFNATLLPIPIPIVLKSNAILLQNTSNYRGHIFLKRKHSWISKGSCRQYLSTLCKFNYYHQIRCVDFILCHPYSDYS